jgi:hypothetical protein
VEPQDLEHIADAGRRADELAAERQEDKERRLYALFLWLMFVALVPSFMVFAIFAGFEPAWVYVVEAFTEGALAWIGFVCALVWSAIYAWAALKISDFIWPMEPDRRRRFARGIPLVLAVLSLLPIYAPVSHGDQCCLNIVQEVRHVCCGYDPYDDDY